MHLGVVNFMSIFRLFQWFSIYPTMFCHSNFFIHTHVDSCMPQLFVEVGKRIIGNFVAVVSVA